MDLAPARSTRAARRGPLPLPAAHDVPDLAASRRCASAATRPPNQPPETRAARHRPNEVLELGHHQAARPEKWTYFYLYVILDVFSRYVVGWMVAQESAGKLASA